MPTPNSQQRLVVGDKIDPVWLRYLRSLEQLSASAVEGFNAQVEAIARALGSPDGSITAIPSAAGAANRDFYISGAGSVTADGSAAGGGFVIGLDNDQDDPGPTKYYGTDSTGNRGFAALAEGLEAGSGIALTDSGYTMLPSVATPDDLPLTGNAGEAVRVTDEARGVYAWDGAAFTLDTAADGKAGVVLDATADLIGYDNAISGLTATDVQAAIDELVTGAGLETFDPAVSSIFMEDFLSQLTSSTNNGTSFVATAGPVAYNSSGSGSANLANSTFGTGVVNLHTGNTATGLVRLFSTGGAIITLNPSTVSRFKHRCFFNALSTSSQRYSFQCGLRDVITGSSTSSIVAEYLESASPNWRLNVTVGGVSTVYTSSIAVTSPAYIIIELVINGPAGTVDLYVDGVLAATHSGSLPTTGMGLSTALTKSVGTTDSFVGVDFHYFKRPR